MNGKCSFSKIIHLSMTVFHSVSFKCTIPIGKVRPQKLIFTGILCSPWFSWVCHFKNTECTYAKTMTTKSSQFQGSRRKVNSPTQKPLARIFTSDSKVYIPVKVYLDTIIQWHIKYEENRNNIYLYFFWLTQERHLLECGCWFMDPL